MKTCCQYIEEFKETGNWNEDMILFAAHNGHLECLKYAHEHRCPWDIYTTSIAASNGHLDCLQYAHEHGCPWDNITALNANCYGYFDCFKYSIENGCPWNEQKLLSKLNKYLHIKIDLDDNWWRTFLFDKDLTSNTSLQTLVNSKKEEIKQLQLSSEILFSYTPKDVVKYVLWDYF